MDEDNQFNLKLQDYKKRCTYVKSYSGFIKQLFQSAYPLSWKIVDFLITKAQNQDQTHFLQLKNQLQMQVSNQALKTFPMLIYVYNLKLTRNDFPFYSVKWYQEYNYVAFQISEITIFSSLIPVQNKSKIVQQTLWLIVKTFPKFIKNQYLGFSQEVLGYVMEWITYFQTMDPDTDKFMDACQLIKFAKETRLNTIDIDYKFTLIKKLLQTVCQCKNPSGNVFFFIYPMPFVENQIEHFCGIYGDFIADLSEEGLCAFFNGLTKGAISKEALVFIEKISNLLVNQQYLYQNFILPILCKRAKACEKVQQFVFNIVSLYVLGFLRHCDIGQIGVQCLCKNIGKITDQNIKMKWFFYQYPHLKNEVKKLLSAQFGKQIQLDNQNFVNRVQDPMVVWDITLRNGRKHKKYVKVPSTMQGILNRNNQCYIISVIHGLQKNKFLEELLFKLRPQIKKKIEFLDELRLLFGLLSKSYPKDPNSKIKINHVKRCGPQPFASSTHQEDAYEYLSKLFEAIENYMKNIPGAIQQFKSIFEFEQLSTFSCLQCKDVKKSSNKAYFHTIPNKSILSEQTQQIVIDYFCNNCQKITGCQMRTKFTSKSKVLIVHINRFSSGKDGKIKKQLSTQTILRKFLNYQLYGIICHKGKTVERGHYVYFHALTPKRWALFNDLTVEQFELEKEYEQFERQWKSQMTPYILFYKQITNPN